MVFKTGSHVRMYSITSPSAYPYLFSVLAYTQWVLKGDYWYAAHAQWMTPYMYKWAAQNEGRGIFFKPINWERDTFREAQKSSME